MTDATLLASMPAFQTFAGHVSAAWGYTKPTLVFGPPPVEAWQIIVLDDSDQAGALGYHDFTPGGKPIAKVFAKTAKQYGYSWSVTLTHELAEMQVDPWIVEAIQTAATRLYAKEVGDPVEADALGYTIKTAAGLPVLVSDFVTPAWFMPGAPGPYDHMHRCGAPLQIREGGYAQYFQNGAWHQVNARGIEVALDADTVVARVKRFRARG